MAPGCTEEKGSAVSLVGVAGIHGSFLMGGGRKGGKWWVRGSRRRGPGVMARSIHLDSTVPLILIFCRKQYKKKKKKKLEGKGEGDGGGDGNYKEKKEKKNKKKKQ